MYDVDQEVDVMCKMWNIIVEFSHVHIYTFNYSLPLSLSHFFFVCFALLNMTYL